MNRKEYCYWLADNRENLEFRYFYDEESNFEGTKVYKDGEYCCTVSAQTPLMLSKYDNEALAHIFICSDCKPIEKKVTLGVGGRVLHLVLGHTLEDWSNYHGCDDDNWDVSFEELIDGTLEINQEIWYWYIDGRCYETTDLV